VARAEQNGLVGRLDAGDASSGSAPVVATGSELEVLQGLMGETTMLGLLGLLKGEIEAAKAGAHQFETLIWSDTVAMVVQLLATLSAGMAKSTRAKLVEAGVLVLSQELLQVLTAGSQSSEQHNLSCCTIRIVGNVAYMNFEAQEQARELGLPQLLLGQCELNVDYPFKREWGMLAIRNLTEGNEKTQQMLQSMQNLGPAPNDQQGIDLEAKGLKVEVDQFGKVRVVNKDDGKPAAAPMAAQNSTSTADLEPAGKEA